MAKAQPKQEEAPKPAKQPATLEEAQAKAAELIGLAKQQIARGEYEKAMANAGDALDLDPGNKEARLTLRQARLLGVERAKGDTKLRHEVEFTERVLDVERASVPYVEPKKIKTTVTDSAYSQEIKTEEEDEFITALRKELDNVRVDLDFRDADLREIIRYLAEVSSINIVIDESAILSVSQANTPAPVVQPVMPVLPGQQAAQAPAAANAPQPPAANSPQPGQPNSAPGNNMNQTVAAGAPQGIPGQPGQPNQPGQPAQPGSQPTAQPQPAAPGSALVSKAGGTETYQAPAPQKQTSPNITVTLKNVPILTALDIILRAKGLKYKLQRDFVWISTEDHLALETLVTRIYTIQHAIGSFANFEAEPLNLTAFSGTNGSDTSSSFMNNSPTAPKVNSGGQSEKTNAQAAEDLIGTLRKIVPQPTGASMTLYQRTGKLIVRNTPGNLRILEGVLRNLDVSSLQVAIEVRLLEVSADDGLDIGHTLGISRTKNGDTNSVSFSTPTQGLGTAITTSSTDGMTMSLSKSASVSLTASIQALVAANRATILSAPKLTCLNNQTANIKIVKNTNYISSTKTTSTTTDGVVDKSVSQTIGQVPEGIILEITPNVSADQQTIRLTVHPQVTEMVDMDTITTDDTTTQLPTVTQRSLDTSVSLKNAGTMVLGGLLRGSEKSTDKGTPGLQAIPVVGHLFKTHNKAKSRNNLIIFITATIMNADGDVLNLEIENKKAVEQLEGKK